MSPKAKPSKKESKSEAKPETKMNKKAAPGKAAKGKAKEAEELQAAPAVDQDELEEQEEQAEAANHAAGGGGNAAALAAASGTQESASFKNFRHHPDMENFYRFIYENDLRHEALAIIEGIMIEKQARKQAGKPGKHAH